jgi:hypothetical protein
VRDKCSRGLYGRQVRQRLDQAVCRTEVRALNYARGQRNRLVFAILLKDAIALATADEAHRVNDISET